MDNIDFSRRFNSMPIAARQALFSLVNAYNDRDLYLYDDKTILNLLGNDKDDVSIKVKLLLDSDFLHKVHTGYKLDRQKADSLLTMGILDLDEEKPELKHMEASNEPSQPNDIPEPTFVDDSPELLDLSLPLNEDYEMNIDPTQFSTNTLNIKIEPKGKNLRFNLVEIVDKSDAGHKINPPIWLLTDQESNKIYAIAQQGLRFADPDNSVYVGIKQLQFIQQNKHYILGVFKNIDNAKMHISKFYDTSVNGCSLNGYLPRKVGNKFWILQKANNGLYCVLPQGIIPPYTMDSRKVDDLTYDEAIGVFTASEKYAEDKEKNKIEKIDDPINIASKYLGDVEFGHNLDSTLSNLDQEFDVPNN